MASSCICPSMATQIIFFGRSVLSALMLSQFNVKTQTAKVWTDQKHHSPSLTNPALTLWIGSRKCLLINWQRAKPSPNRLWGLSRLREPFSHRKAVSIEHYKQTRTLISNGQTTVYFLCQLVLWFYQNFIRLHCSIYSFPNAKLCYTSNATYLPIPCPIPIPAWCCLVNPHCPEKHVNFTQKLF